MAKKLIFLVLAGLLVADYLGLERTALIAIVGLAAGLLSVYGGPHAYMKARRSTSMETFDGLFRALIWGTIGLGIVTFLGIQVYAYTMYLVVYVVMIHTVRRQASYA